MAGMRKKRAAMAWRIGVDIGGTFTDVALLDEDSGRVDVVKVLTTPQDFVAGVMLALRRGLREQAVEPARVALFSHATTIVTNALLEQKGAKAGLVTTRGFRDVLELRRSSRADLYDLFQEAPAVLVPRGLKRLRYRCCSRSSTTPMSGVSASGCGSNCPGSASFCPVRCCRRSASSNAPARLRCAPMLGRCSPPISAGSSARPPGWACPGCM